MTSLEALKYIQELYNPKHEWFKSKYEELFSIIEKDLNLLNEIKETIYCGIVDNDSDVLNRVWEKLQNDTH